MKKTSSFRSRRPAFAALCAALCACALPAAAMVISTGDGTGNTAAPGDDFGFGHVGITSNLLSGVYLGNRWVLTANHVGERDITLLGTPYLAVPGSKIRLANASSPHPDLMLYRLQSGPALPRLALSTATPTVGEDVRCAGNGWNREPDQTHWNALWQEVTPPPPGTFTGYERGVGKDLRWGANEVSEAGVDVDTPGSTTRSILTVFDQNGVADEDAAVTGDSGGGCFAKRSGSWELVGLMFARSSFGDGDGPLADQPPNTAVFGNETIAADVFTYRAQIDALTQPAIPALGGPWALVLAAGLAGAPRVVARRR